MADPPGGWNPGDAPHSAPFDFWIDDLYLIKQAVEAGG
jgi:hypothetical protein